VQHDDRRCGAFHRDEPTVQPDPVGAVEPHLILREIEIERGLMDVSPGRPKRTLERNRDDSSDADANSGSGGDEQWSLHDRSWYAPST
jgi:hypothetical protein